MRQANKRRDTGCYVTRKASEILGADLARAYESDNVSEREKYIFNLAERHDGVSAIYLNGVVLIGEASQKVRGRSRTRKILLEHLEDRLGVERNVSRAMISTFGKNAADIGAEFVECARNLAEKSGVIGPEEPANICYVTSAAAEELGYQRLNSIMELTGDTIERNRAIVRLAGKSKLYKANVGGTVIIAASPEELESETVRVKLMQDGYGTAKAVEETAEKDIPAFVESISEEGKKDSVVSKIEAKSAEEGAGSMSEEDLPAEEGISDGVSYLMNEFEIPADIATRAHELMVEDMRISEDSSLMDLESMHCRNIIPYIREAKFLMFGADDLKISPKEMEIMPVVMPFTSLSEEERNDFLDTIGDRVDDCGNLGDDEFDYSRARRDTDLNIQVASLMASVEADDPDEGSEKGIEFLSAEFGLDEELAEKVIRKMETEGYISGTGSLAELQEMSFQEIDRFIQNASEELEISD